MKHSTLFSRILLCCVLLLALSLSLTGCQSDKSNLMTLHYKDFGDVVIELRPDVAPITAKNFKKLVKEGFYDGLTMHRITDLDPTTDGGFIIQGGDPKGDGTGGSSKKIVGEFSNNGIENALSHTRGVISMARSDDKNSASSQFFICAGDAKFLDGNYAAFGVVVEGMDVVDAIAKVETKDSKPVTPVVIASAEANPALPATPRVFIAIGGSIIWLIAFYVLRSSFLVPVMEDIVTMALRGDKRKRRMLEKNASAWQSYFYLHAKHLIPTKQMVGFSMFHYAMLAWVISLWVTCFAFYPVTWILTAVITCAIVASVCMVFHKPQVKVAPKG